MNFAVLSKNSFTMSKILRVEYYPKPETSVYTFRIYTEKVNPKTEVIIFKITYDFFYPEKIEDNVYELKVNQSKLDVKTGAGLTNLRIRLFLYDFLKDVNSYVGVGYIELYNSSGPNNAPLKKNNLTKASDNGQPWVENLRVTRILGPYQNGEVVKNIDLSKPVIFDAFIGGKKYSRAQFLSIRWCYSIDGGEKVQFKYHNERTYELFGQRVVPYDDRVIMECKMLESWNGKNISVYPYFRSAIESVKASGKGTVPGKPIEEASKSDDCSLLSMLELNQIFTSGSKSEKESILNAYNDASAKLGMNNAQQKAHFFAQVLQEVGPSINVSDGENMNYSAEALPHHFRAFRKRNSKGEIIDKYGNPTQKNSETVPNDLALKYGRSSQNNYKANQKMIANIAYANDDGNGDVQSGDGWRYRGRGIIQITRKGKYDRINERIKKDYPEFNTEIDANNINNLKEGTVASMAYWKDYGCQSIANDGYSRKELDLIVNIINSATDSREKRWKNLKELIVVFNVKDCNSNKSNGQSFDKTEPEKNSDGSSIWHHPLDKLRLRGHYGGGWSPKSSTNDEAKNLPMRSNRHYGLDLYAPVGTPIYACVDGVAQYNGGDPNGYGHRIFLKGKYKGVTYQFMYAHLSTYKPRKVKKGDKIGTTGQSGNAKKQAAKFAHLHFEIRNAGRGKDLTLDPLKIIEELGRDVDVTPNKSEQNGQ